MSRVERNLKKKRFFKNVLYLTITFIILMVLCIIIVDYRVNSTLGNNSIRIVNISDNHKELTIKVFDKYSFALNIFYLKKDYYNFEDNIKSLMKNAGKIIGQAIIYINDIYNNLKTYYMYLF